MDWIDTFMDWTDGIPSPRIFRLWSAITCISGILERRVKIRLGQLNTYPSLFTFLVAPPAVGKSQAISRTTELWREIDDLKVAPNNVTKAALVDCLHKAERLPIDNVEALANVIKLTAKPTINGVYHTLLVPAPELGTLIHRNDLELLSLLNDIYDCPPQYSEERRTMQDRQIGITNPQIVILAGTQPDFMQSVFPDESYGMGFLSRLIMVYANERPKISLFADAPQSDLKYTLVRGLKHRMLLRGIFQWEPSAAVLMEEWHNSDLAPAPQHSKLAHYLGRRLIHVFKLCMISSASRGMDLKITKEDFIRAKRWLLEAEVKMPDIFRSMFAKSDVQILEELHFFMWREWSSVVPKDRKPIQQKSVWEFLAHRVPSEKIERIVDAAEKSGLIIACPTGGWIPATPGSFNTLNGG